MKKGSRGRKERKPEMKRACNVTSQHWLNVLFNPALVTEAV